MAAKLLANPGATHQLLRQALEGIGLEVYEQNVPVVRDDNVVNGKNMWALLKAPRTDGTETLVFVAPLEAMHRDSLVGNSSDLRHDIYSNPLEMSILIVNTYGLATSVSLAKYFSGRLSHQP